MSLFSKLKKVSVAQRKTDETIYSAIAQEMEEGIRHNGLWLRALEKAEGSKERQVAEYIKLRVQSLKDDVSILSDQEKYENSIGHDLDIEELITLIKDDATADSIQSYLSNLESHEILKFINTPDACEEYPIHVSVKRKQIDLVRWFLEAGADPKVENYWGKTPLELAERDESEEIMALLGRYST